jgi:hypothetical protein
MEYYARPEKSAPGFLFRGRPMASPGRKRKNAPRKPGGRLKQRACDRMETASSQPHRRGLSEKDKLDEKAECLLGRMNLQKQISDAQYRAGAEFERVVARYRKVIDAPNPHPGSIAGVGAYGRSEISREECERRKQRYDDAFEALGAVCRRSLMAVSDVAVHDRPARFEMTYLRAGLDALAGHFGYGKVVPFVHPSRVPAYSGGFSIGLE